VPALQRKGVNLMSVPVGRKEAADKAILVDMLFFAMDCITSNSTTGVGLDSTNP
jgi:hypothetical protein